MGTGNLFGDWIPNVSQSTVASIIFGGTCVGAAYCLYATSHSGRCKTRATGAVPPMKNLGNTCYANSLLQALASSSSLVKWLSKVDAETERTGGSVKLIFAVKETISQLNDSSTECCSAADVISALLDHKWSIPSNVEQDLYEFFDVVVTTWDEELAKVKREKGLYLLNEVKNLKYNGDTNETVNTDEHIHLKRDSKDTFSPTYNLRRRSINDVSVAVSAASVSFDSTFSPSSNIARAPWMMQNEKDNAISGFELAQSSVVFPEHVSANELENAGAFNPKCCGDMGTENSRTPFCTNDISDIWLENLDIDQELTRNLENSSFSVDTALSSEPTRDNIFSNGFKRTKIYANWHDGFSVSSSQLFFNHIRDDVAEERKLRLPCSGLLITKLQCMNPACHYTKLRQERFCVLSLSIPKVYPDAWLTLDLLLRRYFSPETIKDASCDKCLEKSSLSGTGIIKKHGLCRLPSLLVLRVERVLFKPSGDVFKSSNRFSFPEILDVEKFRFFARPQVPKLYNGSVESPCSISTSVSVDGLEPSSVNICRLRYQYRLRAVSVHMGEPQSGHFITYRRGIGPAGDSSWYRTSDSKVTRVPFCEVESCEAYMLYYDRVMRPGSSF